MNENRWNANALLSPRRLTILLGAIVLPMALTSCGKKNQEGEKKTIQKGEDNFLDKDTKPGRTQISPGGQTILHRYGQSKIHGRLRATLQVCHSADVTRSV
jgi:hypothetical protein